MSVYPVTRSLVYHADVGNRLRRLSLWIALATLFGCVGCEPASGPPVETVILVSIDSLRADHLGAYGYGPETSPEIDRLAREGLLFSRAYSTTSWTLPSHAALLSGLDDYAHGAIQALTPLPDAVDTLAERLGTAGIASVGFFSGPFLHSSFGLAQGFDEYLDCTSYAESSLSYQGGLAPHQASHTDVTNPILRERIGSWLDRQPVESSPGAPRFIFIHMWDVHYDYIPPPKYEQQFDPDYDGSLTGNGFLKNSRIAPGMPQRDLQHLLALYDGEIRYTDDTLSAILEQFDAKGWLERSAVIITSDHGEEFFEHGWYGHGITLHEEVLKVPLILWVSGQEPRRPVSDEVVSLIDVPPLVCDLFDVDCGYDGPSESLWPQYHDTSPAPLRGNALAEVTNDYLRKNLTAIVGQDGKLVRWNDTGEHVYYPNPSGDGDRKSFPVNPKSRHPKPVRQILSLLKTREESTRSVGRALRPAATELKVGIDSETLRRLESLGYLENR